MKLIIDACTLILLAKASVLEPTLRTFKSSTTEEVYDEVISGKEKNCEDAFIFERLQKINLIEIIDSADYAKIKEDFKMGKGESSIISLGLKNDYTIATDNKQGRKAARVYNLPLVGSIEIIVSLYKKRKIDQEKAISALKKLQAEGWFNTHIIENAMEDLK